MAVCTTCGKSFSVIGNSCPHCHAPLTIEGVKSKKQTESYKGDYDGKSQNLLLLSAFIP